MATFYARYEKALRVLATNGVVDGRLQGKAPIELRDFAKVPASVTPLVTYELFGAGDVQRLGPSAITRRFPSPGTSDAEMTKLALVEFSALDLPWRYTPQPAAGEKLPPWVFLVVGRLAPDGIVLRPDGRVTLGTAVQKDHKLKDSWMWAHVHEVDGRPIARLLCPAPLAEDTDYVACVVPAFTPAGAYAWTGVEAVTCECYDRWTFRTGPLGDFPVLAGKLRSADLAAIEAAGGRPFGRADLTYAPRTPGADSVVLPAAGALRRPPDPAGGADPGDAPPDPAIRADVEALTERIVTPDGRGVVTTPRYDAPFADAAGVAAGGWIDQLRSDPRGRGAAGLGAWAAIEWQDRISDAAAAKAGDLAIAHDRIRHVALGVEASRSLWRRRVPEDPAARLAVLAPVLGRLPSASGMSVLDEVAGRTPDLTRALLSSAARRALRPGPARAALARDGAGSFGDVLAAANQCPPRFEDPADISVDHNRSPDDIAAAVTELILAASPDDLDMATQILDRLGPRPSPGQLVGALRALASGPDGRPDPRAVEEFLRGRDYPEPDPSLSQWPGLVNELAPPEPCRPINLKGLSDAVAGAVDPTVERPPAVLRVLSTLPGFTHVGPVEIEPELDLPLWSFLEKRSPDWLLPGVGDLAEHDVVALSTNPAFVQALLVGANAQATAELRWRNIPITSRWSPLRKFWQRRSGGLDIAAIKGWPEATPLGSTALAAPDVQAEAVVAFRTSLFRRYPATVVYLYPMEGTWNLPAENRKLEPPLRKDFTFTGTIGDDVTFFGFAQPPEVFLDHWVVLEEPPAGHRFSHDIVAAPPVTEGASSVPVAYNRFALPVRVLIGPLVKLK